jgi:prepilin-type N-terminal cleavage/methylation domain-containing protein
MIKLGQNGFTVLELVVTLLCICILVAIVILFR